MTAIPSSLEEMQLLNPSTPMAFLPPEIAYQVTISVYIVVGAMGVCVFCKFYVGAKLIKRSIGDDLGYPQSLEIGLCSALQISHPRTYHRILRLEVCGQSSCQWTVN